MRIAKSTRAVWQFDLDDIPSGAAKVVEVTLLVKIALLCDQLRKGLAMVRLRPMVQGNVKGQSR
jgi:hypothetical protein